MQCTLWLHGVLSLRFRKRESPRTMSAFFILFFYLKKNPVFSVFLLISPPFPSNFFPISWLLFAIARQVVVAASLSLSQFLCNSSFRFLLFGKGANNSGLTIEINKIYDIITYPHATCNERATMANERIEQAAIAAAEQMGKKRNQHDKQNNIETLCIMKICRKNKRTST